MKKADSSLSAIPHADKSFRLVGAKAKEEDALYDYERDGLRSADLLVNDGLQAGSKRALAEDDYLALETLSKQRLALVPTSLMAQKNLAQAQFRRSQDSLEARRFKEAEGLLLECLAWQRGQMGERHEAVGRSLLQLAKVRVGRRREGGRVSWIRPPSGPLTHPSYHSPHPTHGCAAVLHGHGQQAPGAREGTGESHSPL